MPATYTVFPINSIWQMTVRGTLDLDSRRALMLDVVHDAELNGHNLLVDMRDAAGDVSYRDVHELIQVLIDHPDAFTHRIGVLEPYTARFEKAQFFQAYAVERGFAVHAFLDEAEAVQWLEEGVSEAD